MVRRSRAAVPAGQVQGGVPALGDVRSLPCGSTLDVLLTPTWFDFAAIRIEGRSQPQPGCSSVSIR
jgi:hypothetical protein